MAAKELVWYKCPRCGRVVRLPKGSYYCSVCGPKAMSMMMPIIERVEPEKEKATMFLKRHPAMDAVYSVLDLDKTLTPTTKNVLWQDFVAAWNRRRLLTNEQAELLLKLRW